MNRQERSDAEIVAAVLDGDRDSFGLLVARYQQRIHSAMWRATGDAAEAEELTQAVFCRTYFALATYDPSYSFSTWIYRIAHNLCINTRTRGLRALSLEAVQEEGGGSPAVLADPGPTPEERRERRELADRIRDALAQLPDEFREVVFLRHVQELSYAEICDVTGLPMGTVKSRIARGRRLLAASLSRS
ncbi:MAG: sigma-70 family RNA polymerase sigma factor [Caldilineae bacterium]|nr:sigma-70 family RNA polymerase sigma factor [Chloroflexota bacterium]MCB9176705.1 sigma-70 family RNA polymerase sigma factor [Caldilineae bacterium]